MSFRNIAVSITGDSRSLGAALRRAATQVEGFSRGAERRNKRLTASWKLLAHGVAAAATIIGVALGATLIPAAQFEQRMRNVNSISGMSEQSLAGLSRQVLALSRTLPQSANVLAEGLYDIASSGFQGAAGLTVLRASAEAASAGLTTTAEAAKAITAVLNAYGMGADQASAVSDALFQTVNLGVVTFEELTSVIGDVVGTAAAASVSIDQVGSAVATMTLSGISAAEAGTSLNRVLQSLLQPSDALATVYQTLGFTSGEAALKANGLRGVMEQLRQATGGNVTTLLALFPDIRAARGALALMSDEGRNYAKVAAGIEDADKRQGATKRALAEQLKAVSAQWTIFMNGVRATAIQTGTRLLPAVLSLLRGVRALGSAGLPVLRDALSALTPFFTGLRAVGEDVVSILTTLWQVTSPLAKALLGIAGGTVIAALNTLAATVSTVTGFLAQHKGLAVTLAAVYLATLLPSLAQLRVAFNKLVLTPVVLGLTNLLGAAGAAAGGVRGLTAALRGLIATETVATAGLYAMVAAFTGGFVVMSNEAAKAKAAITDLGAGSKVLDESGAKFFFNLQKKIESSEKVIKRYDSLLGSFKGEFLQILNPFDDNELQRAKATLAEAQKAIGKLSEQMLNARRNLDALSRGTGVTVEELAKLAVAADIDLSKPFAESADARAKVVNELRKIEAQAGTTASAMAGAVGMDINAMQQLAEAVAKAGEKATEAFTGATDIIANLGKDQTLTAFYATQLQQGKQFADGIRQVTARGLDPQFVARLLQAGPERAAPILQQLLADHSGKMIKMVNDAETQLRGVNAKVVEFARLTQLAVSSETDTLATNLGLAMSIANQRLAQGGQATAASIAQALGVAASTVAGVANQFGITLAGQVQGGLNANRPTVDVAVDPALAKIRRVEAAINALQSRTMYVDVVPRSARPGLFAKGGITRRAHGGVERHVPQIAPGTWRVWAEPETGGEAYIPLANDWRRPRALRIWQETGRLLGAVDRSEQALRRFATGGISTPVAFGTVNSSGVTVQTTVNVNGPVFGVDDLRRQVRATVDERDTSLAHALRSHR